MLLFALFVCATLTKAQDLGDYMEIDGVPGFVFYLDETGEHGLVMSMFPYNESWMKFQTKKLRNEDLITEAHIHKLSIIKESSTKSVKKACSKKMMQYYMDLKELLGDEGEENRTIINKYCKEKKLPLSTFIGQDFAESLGDGWFIPGDKELELFAIFLWGGLGEKFMTNNNMIAQERSNNPVVQFIMNMIINCHGLLSSTIKHNSGFRVLTIESKGKIGYVKFYGKICDVTSDNPPRPILEANPYTRICAVHKF